jgi:hypothetical protein
MIEVDAAIERRFQVRRLLGSNASSARWYHPRLRV